MIPRSHHPHDKRWIKSMLERLPVGIRATICDAYGEAYDAAYEAESVMQKKDGAARRAANARLRVFVDRRTGVRL